MSGQLPTAVPLRAELAVYAVIACTLGPNAPMGTPAGTSAQVASPQRRRISHCNCYSVTTGLPWVKTYTTALRTPYRHWVQPPRRQAPEPTHKPRWLPLPELLYAQVVELSGADVPASVSRGLPKVLCLRGDGPSLPWSRWLVLTGQPPFSVGSRSTTTFLKRFSIPYPRPKGCQVISKKPCIISNKKQFLYFLLNHRYIG
jgi:hypothetical protein